MRRYNKVALKVELSSAVYFRKISTCYNSPYGFVSTSCTRSRIAVTQLNRQRSLRSTSDHLLYVPKPNIEQFRNSISYSGSKIWNSIPENIRLSDSIISFKKRYLEWSSTQIDHLA